MATVTVYTKAGADAADDVGSAAVTSVNGDVGAVVLDLADIAETATAKKMTDVERTKLATVGTAAWTSYSPYFTAGGATGNATCTGASIVVGKTVHFWAKVALGTTSTVTGTVQVSLPVTAKSTSSFAVLSASMTDAGVANYQAAAVLSTTASAGILPLASSAAYVTWGGLNSTTPFTWGAGDEIEVRGTYEAA